MLRGLPHWLGDGWDGVRFCAHHAGAEPGTRPNDERGDPRRLHRRLARGPPPARLPSRLARERESAVPFLVPLSGSGDDALLQACFAVRFPLGGGSPNAPAVRSPPASLRPSPSGGQINPERLAATRTESAGIQPYFSLSATAPPSAQQLLAARVVAFAWSTSCVGQFTPIHSREKANWYEKATRWQRWPVPGWYGEGPCVLEICRRPAVWYHTAWPH